jgi:hypothetical protein
MPITEQAIKFIAELAVYSGGAAAFSYLLFQYLGKSWIENKFAQRLDTLKHQHELELQRLRIEIDSLLSGAIKLQEREFEYLPEAWHKLDEAHGLVTWLVSPGQEYPNLDRMNPLQLNEFLDSSKLTNSQKEEIRSATKKDDSYQEIIFWLRLHRVEKAISDLQNFVARNGIFFPSEIKQNFKKISELLWSAVISKKVGYKAEDYQMQSEGWKQIKNEAEPIYKSLEEAIQNHLQSHGRKV